VSQTNGEGEVYGGEYSVDDENQLQPEDTLVDRGLDDALDEGYSPPDREPANLRYGTTAEEERAGETLDQRLLQEEPEPDPFAEGEEPWAEQWPDDALADRRAGRLVAPDQGVYEDHDQAPLAEDVGIDGAGASAEEAAMHIEGEF
jgi:hypothetical protein